MVNIFDKFKKITKIDILAFIDSYVLFMDREFINIYNYYQGKSSIFPSSSFKYYSDVLKQSEIVNQVISQFKNNFDSYEYWDLLSTIESINLSLETIKSIPKLSRSSIIDSNYKQGKNYDYVLKEGSNFEIDSSKLGYVDFNSTSVDITLSNKIEELDYKSGDNFKYRYRGNNSSSISTGIISTSNDDIYGIDIAKNLNFKEDDLNVLNTEQTLNQTIDVFIALKRGDIPEFPEKGLESDLLNDENLISQSLGIVLRNYNNLFLQDDIFESVNFEGVELDQDNINLNLIVKTREGLTIKKGIYAS